LPFEIWESILPHPVYTNMGSSISVVNSILFDGENNSFEANLVIYIQGVPGGMCQTSRECYLC